MKGKPQKVKAIGKIVVILLAVILLAKACKKDKFELPVVHTGEAVEITPDGVIFYGKIIEQGNREITDHGFVWLNQKNPTLQNSYVKSLGELKEEVFKAEITSGLTEGEQYFLRAYVRVDEKTIYGREVSFMSLGSKAPLITGFEPLQATWHDTLSIFGRNFSLKPGENSVKLQNVLCEVIFETDTIIHVIVPENLLNSQATVSITFLGNIAIAEQLFQLTPPEVYDFSPKQGTSNTQVVITGRFFHPNATEVFFGEKKAQVTEISGSEIKCLAPQGVSPGENVIKVRVIDQDVFTSETFNFIIPEISELIPSSGIWLQNVTIKGSNFSENLTENTVKFHDTQATILHASQDSLVVIVPENVVKKESQVTVTVQGETSQDGIYFNLSEPVINSINPPNGTFHDIIEIHGEFFNPVAQNNQVLFNNTQAVVLHSTSDLISVRVPENITNIQNTVKVLIGDMQAVSDETFQLDLHAIDSFTPTNGVLGNNIVIFGYGFNPIKENNTVLINNQPAELLSASLDSITVDIPGTTPHGEHFIVVSILGRDVQSHQPFMFHQPWTRLNDPPFGPRYRMVSFNIGNRIFVGGGSSPDGVMSDFYEYFPLTDTWIERASIPGQFGYRAWFSTANKGYVIRGSLAVYSYDPDLDQWAAAGNYPIEVYGPIAFSVNDVAYIVGGGSYLNDTYRFNEDNNTWSPMANYPFNGTQYGIGFGIADKGYIALGNENTWDGRKIYSYNPALNSWHYEISLSGFIDNKRWLASAFEIEGKAYFGTGRNVQPAQNESGQLIYISYNDFYEFSPDPSAIRFIGNLPASKRYFTYTFSGEGFGFLGGGYLEDGPFIGEPIYFNDLYKFDPAKLPPWLK